MAQTGPSKKLQRALNANNKAARRLKQTQNSLRIGLQRLRGELTRAGVQTRNLGFPRMRGDRPF